jgi:hypothetical protein
MVYRIIILLLITNIAYCQVNYDDNNIKSYGEDSLVLESSEVKVNRITNDSIFHAHGGFQDSAVAIGGTQNIWYPVSNTAHTLWTGTEFDGMTLSGDTMIIYNAGDYYAIIGINFAGTNQQEYEFRIYDVNGGVQEGFELGDTGNGANNWSKFCGAIYIEAETDNDRFVLQFRNVSGNNGATFIHANFTLIYVHN